MKTLGQVGRYDRYGVGSYPKGWFRSQFRHLIFIPFFLRSRVTRLIDPKWNYSTKPDKVYFSFI